MKNLAVIYHSAQGNTKRIAQFIVEGAAGVPGVRTELLRAEDLVSSPERLLGFDGFIFGSPTYLGGVSGQFKSFMDATGRLWKTHALKGKLASGFTVSAFKPGDIKTAHMFGRNIARALTCMSCAEELEAVE